MMRCKWIMSVCASVLSLTLIISLAYAVAGKTLTVTKGGQSVPKLRIQQRAPDGQVTPLPQTRENDNRKVVVPLLSESGTIEAVDEATGKVYTLMGPGGVLGTVMTGDGNYVSDLESVPVSAMGGGAAAASTASGWSAAQARGESTWWLDGILSLGGTASLGSKDATTTTGGLAINGQSTSGLSGLGGTTGGLMLRAHLPAKWTGTLGDTWLFLRGNYHFDRIGTGGFRNAHNPVPGDETSTKFKRGGDIEFGVGKSVTTYCHEGNIGCQYIGVYFGGSIQQNTITVTSNEIVRQPSFEKSAWKPSYVAGVWYSVPLGGIGTGWDDYGLVLGADFRRVPCMTVNGSTPLPGTYQGHVDTFWEVTTWGGISYTF